MYLCKENVYDYDIHSRTSFLRDTSSAERNSLNFLTGWIFLTNSPSVTRLSIYMTMTYIHEPPCCVMPPALSGIRCFSSRTCLSSHGCGMGSESVWKRRKCSLSKESIRKYKTRSMSRGGGAGVETKKNVRGEIGGWGRVPFNEPYSPSLSTIYDGA